ncbi:hypothetical protein BC936DRAFT_144059 [Jimgerdemannia flammicorona]|uniref:Uncharacterized protein n=1 Tax=Jimgerdemannia flammicorona TaxID=994334 RepID=A0A433DD52_9FUNG|nr:hypothetical protein BC936DRAFT_144059 [Jimgerdemannia flammicorona]
MINILLKHFLFCRFFQKKPSSGIWHHSHELEKLSVRERLEKRKAESQAIAYATENASKKLRTHAQVQGQKVAERGNAALSSVEVEEQKDIADDHEQEENTEESVSEPNIKDQDEDLQKAWEFERSIPGWLGCIHQHRKKVTTTSDSTLQSQTASNVISWHIIDACDLKLTDIITQQEFLELQNDITSYLPSGWMVLEPPAERCLYSISMVGNYVKFLDKKELKKVAKTVLYDGIRGAIKEIRKIPAIRSKDKNENENPFLDSQFINDTTSDDKIIQEDDYNHPDVCYILELLRYTYKMISKKIPQRTNSERDIDIFFKSHMFSCFDDILDTHLYVQFVDFRVLYMADAHESFITIHISGEVVSRASRNRRMQAIDASADAEGYHLDWIFTKHDLAKNLTWGQEVSLCERAGSKIENGRKILDNTLKVQKTLRDMHRTLLDTLSEAGGGVLPAKIIQAFGKLLLPGFVSSGFFVRVLLNVYLGGGYYGSTKLAEFDIPTLSEELGRVVTMARTMLNVKNILRQTIKTFALMKEAAEKRRHSMDDVLVPPRVKEQVTPKKLRSKK